MIIYNPHDAMLIKQRITQAKDIFEQLPAKYCFISGSFLYKKKYNDLDIFVITRSAKQHAVSHPDAQITVLDFNELHGLFYHSIAKSCVAKNLLPTKPLKVTLADYWGVINEAIPTLFNEKDNFRKVIRSLVLYTEFFKSGIILDSLQLQHKISSFNNYTSVLEYIQSEIPLAIQQQRKPSYLKRFFYTQAGQYKKLSRYIAHRFLYQLTQSITEGLHHG